MESIASKDIDSCFRRNDKHCFCSFAFLLIFCRGQKKSPPIIGATCGFDAKIYKNVGGVFDVSSGRTRNKKNFQISDFCFQLPAHLVEKYAISAPPSYRQIRHGIPGTRRIPRVPSEGRLTAENLLILRRVFMNETRQMKPANKKNIVLLISQKDYEHHAGRY